MTQISQKSKALVDWNSAKVFAKLLSNENCLWTIFPPKKEGGRCYHFPTETNFERKVEECLKNNPKHSLGLIVNPNRILHIAALATFWFLSFIIFYLPRWIKR